MSEHTIRGLERVRTPRTAGIDGLVCYDLRHSFASHLVMAGVNLTSVKELMGHNTVAMTLMVCAPGTRLSTGCNQLLRHLYGSYAVRARRNRLI
jgi:site-specific recombinase XerC